MFQIYNKNVYRTGYKTYKGSLKSNFIGEGGLFGDCQNKPNKIQIFILNGGSQ